MPGPLGLLDSIPASAVVEGLSDAVLVVDAEGRIQAANRRALRLFDHTWTELRDQPIEMLVPEAAQRRHGRERRRYQKTPLPRVMGTGLDLRARRRDGTAFPVDISLTPIHIEAVPYVVAVVRNLTDRLAMEEELFALRTATTEGDEAG